MSFVYGLVVGVLACLVAEIIAAIALVVALSRRHPARPRDPELDLVLRRFAERGPDQYDAMCRDCGGIHQHRIGCPELDRAR